MDKFYIYKKLKNIKTPLLKFLTFSDSFFLFVFNLLNVIFSFYILGLLNSDITTNWVVFNVFLLISLFLTFIVTNKKTKEKLYKKLFFKFLFLFLHPNQIYPSISKKKRIVFTITPTNLINLPANNRKIYLKVWNQFYSFCHKNNIQINIIKQSNPFDLLHQKKFIEDNQTLKKLNNDLELLKTFENNPHFFNVEVVIELLDFKNNEKTIENFLTSNFKNCNFQFNLKFLNNNKKLNIEKLFGLKKSSKVNFSADFFSIKTVIKKPETIDNSCEIAKKFFTILGIHQYPEQINVQFLEEYLFKIKTDNHAINLDFFYSVTPINKKNFLELIKKSKFLTNINIKNIKTQMEDDILVKIQNKAITDIIDKVLEKNEPIFNLYFYIIIKDESVKTLRKNVEFLQKHLENTCDLIIEPFINKQILVFNKLISSNFQKNHMYFFDVPQEILGETLSAFHPFSYQTHIEENAFLFAKDLNNNSPIFFSLHENLNKTNTLIKNQANQNGFIIGTSGMGKSFYTKKLIINILKEGNNVIIFDPDGEYEKISIYLEKPNISIDNSLKSSINPLQIFNFFPDNFLAEHLNFLSTFFKILIPSLDDISYTVIDEIITEIFSEIVKKADEQINTKDEFKLKSFLLNLKPEDFPTIKDIYNKIPPASFDKFPALNLLKKFTKENNFNHPTNVNLNNNLVVLDFKALLNVKNDVVFARFLLLFKYINFLLHQNKRLNDNIKIKNKENLKTKYTSEAFIKPKHLYIIIDEAHLFLKSNTTVDDFILDEFVQLTKRARKYNCGLIFTTQNINDFIDCGSLKAETIINNCQFQTFFALRDNDKNKVLNLFKSNLNLEVIASTLPNLNIHEALLLLNNFHQIKLEVVSSVEEQQLFSTSFVGELNQINYELKDVNK